MALLIFSFAIHSETKEASFAGNIDPAQALHLLQDILISQLQSRVLLQTKAGEGKKDVQMVQDNPKA